MQNKTSPLFRWLGIAVLLILIPIVIFVGVKVFADREYHIISVVIAFLSCVPFFLRFERSKAGAREVIIIAVMAAFSVLGRLIFAPLPGFKPVTAITVISGVALGPEAGFLVGSVSAIVSNIYFGQGPWTPFQMFVWGIIGFLAGILFRNRIKPNRIALCIFGALSGVLFSAMMDIWTVLAADGTWSWKRYAAAMASAVPFTIVYAVSNVIFLVILSKPFLEKLGRIKTKYGIET